MPLQEIVEEALAPALAPTGVVSLSSARGKTNREVAEIMVVRVKTVETYVTRILDKLGFDSRVQIATWAIEVGLAELDKDVT